jgi:hypothetical protein
MDYKVVITSCQGVDRRAQLFEMRLQQLARRSVVLDAQGCRSRERSSR